MKAKKLLSLLLLIAMTISMFVPVQAADTSGKIGDNVTWTYDASTKTITLSGSGATYDYKLDKTTYTTGSPLEAYDYVTEKIIVEEGITYLGECIFRFGNFSELHIPKSVTKIKGSAFGIIYGADNTHVYYAGTEAEWNALDRDYDFYFEDAIMHYGTASSNSNISSAPVTSTPQTSTATTTKATQTATSSNTIKVYIDNKIVSFDVQPRLVGGRTMVPLRAIFEGIGATVDWNGDTQTVTAFNEVTIVTATIGQYTMTVNGTKKTMDVPPMVIDNRTLVPARFVAEAFDCDVRWDGSTQTVYITTKPLDYSKVEQDISVATPSTTPAETTPVIEEPAKSDKPYKVETITTRIRTSDVDFSAGSTSVLHNNDLYYSLTGERKIMKVNVLTGKTETFIDFSDYEVDYNGEKWNVKWCYEIDYDTKRDVLVSTKLFLNKENKLNGKTEEKWCYYFDLIKRREIEKETGGRILGIYENGNLLLSGGWSSGIQFAKQVKYPKYSEIVDDYSFYVPADAVDLGSCTIKGKLYYLNEAKIFVDGRFFMETYGNSVGANSKNLFMMNDSSVFKLDEDGEIISTISFEDVEEADGKDVFNDKGVKFFVTENEDIIFYDLDENVFRRITKN